MDDSIIGTEVEGYRIQEVLGRGGMGVVYRAEDLALSREVALKRIDPSLANDEVFLRRFRSEARALARIDSPYIVSVYALRQTEIGLLLVMEYVEGGTLKDLIHEGPMGWEKALPIVKQMLTALEHAHSAEVIHRDIKPRNVMLSQSGTVKVTDFGLAKLYRPDSDETVTRGVHGTLNYMSPEQVQGGDNLDHRSDLYSLGMTVYEMVAGRLPFDEDDSEFAIMQTIVGKELPRPTQFRPEIPDAFVRVIMKALEKAPDDRFQSPQAMRKALEAFEVRQEEAGDTITAEATPAARTSPDGHSGTRVAGIGLLVVLLVVGGYFLYGMMGRGGAPNGDGRPEGNQGPETPSPVSTTALSIDTDPVGASVYHSGRLVGVTPLDYKVDDDSAELRVRKAGFVPLDTTLTLGDEQKAALSVQLTREVSQTALTVSTEPSGATVYLEGDPIGATPLDYALEGSTAQLRLHKEGYVPVDTVSQLDGTQRVRLDLQLSKASTATPPSSRGAYDLSVSPTGTVIVDNQRYEGSASVELPVGRHQVRFRHPEYGTMDTTVTVQEGQNQELTCYFEHTIRVLSAEQRGSVYLDGVNTEASPPHTLSRGPGIYRVGVRILRDLPHTVPGGVYRKMVDDRRVEQVEFSGNEKAVIVEPSFSPETHVVTFRTRSLLEQARGEFDGLQQDLKRAIEGQVWGDLPAPLAEFYRGKLAGLYAEHEVRKVNIVVEAGRTRGSTVVFPVTAYIEYQQKGREGVKAVPFPANWVWGKTNGGVEVLRIQPR